MIIKILEQKDEFKYVNFILKNKYNLLYVSLEYREILEKLLKCKILYLIAERGNEIEGCFPLMLASNKKFGDIINSLPFYGSNGGIIVDENLDEKNKNEIRHLLLNEANQIVNQNNCAASTFITNPLDKGQNNWFRNNVRYDFIDERIGQITILPEFSDDFETELLKKFDDPRPRNIRKALKSEISVYTLNNEVGFDFLYKTHKSNIEELGGIPKKQDFFQNISKSRNILYNLYVAEKDSKMIAALLLFYFNKTVEYFTPVTVAEFRNFQPGSLIIFSSMKDAIKNGYKFWNWGGTWLTQDGVYDFKKKWGAINIPYYYYTNIHNKEILNLSVFELLKEYPNFYVVPFNQLIK